MRLMYVPFVKIPRYPAYLHIYHTAKSTRRLSRMERKLHVKIGGPHRAGKVSVDKSQEDIAVGSTVTEAGRERIARG